MAKAVGGNSKTKPTIKKKTSIGGSFRSRDISKGAQTKRRFTRGQGRPQ